MTHDEKLKYLKEAGETIGPQEMSMLLGGNPYSYTVSAKQGKLGLPFVWRGRNLRVFTAPLIRILNGGTIDVPFND